MSQLCDGGLYRWTSGSVTSSENHYKEELAVTDMLIVLCSFNYPIGFVPFLEPIPG